MCSLQHFLPAVSPYAHTNKPSDKHTDTQTAGLPVSGDLGWARRLRMGFTSTHPHILFHRDRLPAHPCLLSFLSFKFLLLLPFFVMPHCFPFTLAAVMNVLNPSLCPSSTCHKYFRSVTSRIANINKELYPNSLHLDIVLERCCAQLD